MGTRRDVRMKVPWQQVPPESLRNLIEEFVTRDGTDYGESEVSLESKVTRVQRLLQQEEAVIWFDDATETISILPREQVED